MRILYCVSLRKSYMYQWQHLHIFDELSCCGVEFVQFDPEKYETSDAALTALKQLLRQDHFDLFMTGYGHTYVIPELLDNLRVLGIPTLLFCADNLLIPYEHHNIAPYFDLVWLTARETEYLFTGRGANTIFLPYAANPNIFKGYTNETINRVLFIGSTYGSRVNMINKLASGGVDIDLFGGGSENLTSSGVKSSVMARNIQRLHSTSNLLKFPVGRKVLMGVAKQKLFGAKSVLSSPYIHKHPGLSFDLMYSAYAKYAVSLASTAARNTGVLRSPVNVINLRSFEIPMSGGVQFCAYSDELASYFEEGREIVFYRSEEELVEKAIYLTSERGANDVSSIRKHARDRALRDHTWTRRFSEVFSRLGISHKLSHI